jgi:predicted nucleotidyltransferase
MFPPLRRGGYPPPALFTFPIDNWRTVVTYFYHTGHAVQRSTFVHNLHIIWRASLNRLTNIPEEKQALLKRLVGQLSKVSGVVAVVLGGSYASGTQRDNSDMDIGLYYLADTPFEISEIERIAEDISIQPPTVTKFYEWGHWVNGGAWIQTGAGKVDLLYRNITQVELAIQNAQLGIVEHDYDQQPTHGFYSIIYLAEIQICFPLHDPEFHISRMKQMVKQYPSKLKEKVIANSLWSAEFTLLHANTFASCGDVYNTAGCLTRIGSSLTQALFAMNERYFIGDKRVMDTVSEFVIQPEGYIKDITGMLAHPGETASELILTVANMQRLWRKMVALTEGNYQPAFVLPH